MHCPTKDELLASLLALLPRGRAWQTNEGGPEPYRNAPFDPVAFDPAAFDTDSRQGSILYRFWEGVAYVFAYLYERICALELEMFCATQSETNDQWLIEYGLPDACDPFPDLCVKVAAIGGASCDYFRAVAARAGWSIDCVDLTATCGGQAGCDQAGCDQTGARQANALQLIVYLDDSPSFGGTRQTPAQSGLLQAGQPLACDPDLTPLRCIIARIAPAHVSVVYFPV